jgi:hypothetical protein
MNIFLMIIAIHAALVGFALVFAGFASLVAPTDQEVETDRKLFETERAKGIWRYTIFCIGQAGAAKSKGLNLAISHWPERSNCRHLIYAGAACLAMAALIGYHLGTFDSPTNRADNSRPHLAKTQGS